jgi:hypothetical protein
MPPIEMPLKHLYATVAGTPIRQTQAAAGTAPILGQALRQLNLMTLPGTKGLLISKKIQVAYQCLSAKCASASRVGSG